MSCWPYRECSTRSWRYTARTRGDPGPEVPPVGCGRHAGDDRSVAYVGEEADVHREAALLQSGRAPVDAAWESAQHREQRHQFLGCGAPQRLRRKLFADQLVRERCPGVGPRGTRHAAVLGATRSPTGITPGRRGGRRPRRPIAVRTGVPSRRRLTRMRSLDRSPWTVGSVISTPLSTELTRGDVACLHRKSNPSVSAAANPSARSIGGARAIGRGSCREVCWGGVCWPGPARIELACQVPTASKSAVLPHLRPIKARPGEELSERSADAPPPPLPRPRKPGSGP